MAGEYSLGDLVSQGQLDSNTLSGLFSNMGYGGIGDGGNSGWDMPSWSGMWGGNNEVGNQMYNFSPTDEAMGTYDGYSFDWSPEDMGAGTLTSFDPKGKFSATYKQHGEDWMDQVAGMAIPALVTGGFGSALGGMFGGGILGKAAGHGLASGSLSSMQGGSFGEGFLGGAIGGGLQGLSAGTPAVMGNNPSAYVPGTPGTSIAGSLGVTNPTLSGMVNRGAGSALGALAQGKDGNEVLQSGLTGAGLAGINAAGKGVMDFASNSLKSFLGGGDSTDMDFDSLQGSGGDMSGQTDVSPNRYAEFNVGSDGMETYNPDYGFGGGLDSFSSLGTDKSIQSVGQSDFSLPSVFGDVGRSVGNFASNNVGDLASMLYGFYNNRKQQKALGQQASSLQGLFGQNSPYAQQLRAKLNAQAAQQGRRSNTAGRETQFQAMLADRNAQMSPHLMQLNQAKGQLQNSMGSNMLSMFNKMGGFNAVGRGLQGLFQPQSSLTGPGSYNAYQNMDNMYGTVG